MPVPGEGSEIQRCEMGQSTVMATEGEASKQSQSRAEQSDEGWLTSGCCGEGRVVGEYLDGLSLGLVLAAAVEVGHHAEAAAAVLDEAHGGAPSPLRLFGGVLRRHFEVLLQVALQPLHPSHPPPPGPGDEERARRDGESGGNGGFSALTGEKPVRRPMCIYILPRQSKK